MGVVGLAHHVVLADFVDADAVVVLDEAAEDVIAEGPPDVQLVEVDIRRGVAGEFLAAQDPVPLLVEDLLGPLEEVGDPTDFALRKSDFRFGNRWKRPLNSQANMVPDVREAPQVRLAMNGASLAICGRVDDDPTCMQTTISSSFAVVITGSQ